MQFKPSKMLTISTLKHGSWGFDTSAVLHLQDVQKPEPLRLRRNLSAIINFCKFRDEKVYAFEELNQRLAALSHDAEAAEEQRAKNVS